MRHWHSRVLGRDVDVDIYLPPEYYSARSRSYPLLLLNDGQDLPAMRFFDTLEQLYRQEAVPHTVVVGVYAGRERHREYGTARQADYKGRGDKAALYRDFVLTELMPLLHRRFRLSGLTRRIRFWRFFFRWAVCIRHRLGASGDFRYSRCVFRRPLVALVACRHA